MKPGIADLGKWTEKTAGAVRRICSNKEAPCVGFGLAFFDPMEPGEEKWNFVIELAFDPHNPPPEEEQKEVQKALEFIARGVAHIMGGEQRDIDLEELIVHGKLH